MLFITQDIRYFVGISEYPLKSSPKIYAWYLAGTTISVPEMAIEDFLLYKQNMISHKVFPQKKQSIFFLAIDVRKMYYYINKTWFPIDFPPTKTIIHHPMFSCHVRSCRRLVMRCSCIPSMPGTSPPSRGSGSSSSASARACPVLQAFGGPGCPSCSWGRAMSWKMRRSWCWAQLDGDIFRGEAARNWGCAELVSIDSLWRMVILMGNHWNHLWINGGFYMAEFPIAEFGVIFWHFPKGKFTFAKGIFLGSLPLAAPRMQETDGEDIYGLSDEHFRSLKESKKWAKRGGMTDTLVWEDKLCNTLVSHYGTSLGKGNSQLVARQAPLNPRRFTPRECARLMGFPDSYWLTERPKENPSMWFFGSFLVNSFARFFLSEMSWRSVASKDKTWHE